MRKGLIQIYTGDGKGKTTASVGLAVRARGHGFKVCMVRFFKDSRRFASGEDKILKKIGVKVHYFACEHPHFYKKINLDKLKQQCCEAADFIKNEFKKNKLDILILDEINICLRDKFLKEKEILSLLKKKPKRLEVVLTGRSAPKALLKRADLVSYVKNIKHPFDKGIRQRKGIEY